MFYWTKWVLRYNYYTSTVSIKRCLSLHGIFISNNEKLKKKQDVATNGIQHVRAVEEIVKCECTV